MVDDGGEEDSEDSGPEDQVSPFVDLIDEIENRTNTVESSPSDIDFEPDDQITDGDDSYLSDVFSRITSSQDRVEPELDHAATAWDQANLLSDSKSRAIIELIKDTANILLLGPLICPAEYEVGSTLMDLGEHEPINLLLVTFSQSPDERLNILRTYLDIIPDELKIVNVGEQTRGAAATTVGTDGGTITIESISDPTDLKRIGITIDKTLSEWEGNGNRTVVCFHSLTALLQFMDDPKRAFRFLNILRGRIKQCDAHAHYHLDDGAHDEELIEILRPIFDAVIRYTEEGAVSIDH